MTRHLARTFVIAGGLALLLPGPALAQRVQIDARATTEAGQDLRDALREVAASIADEESNIQNVTVDPQDGGRYATPVVESYTTTSYANFLPSASVAYNLRSNLLARGSMSKTITRADAGTLFERAARRLPFMIDHEAERSEHMRRLHTVLSELEPRERTVLYLVDGQGYTVTAAAGIMGVARETAARARSSARRKLALID